jgi:site-specific recombinase XerD
MTLGAPKGSTPANKGRKYPAEPLSRAEADRLIGACSARSATGMRNRALLAVMYRAGLRLDEALSLRASSIDPDRGSIRVLHGKGNKMRLAGIDPAAMAVVQLWMNARTQLDISSAPLFCTLSGRKLSPVYVRNLVRRLGKTAGIDKRVHPHGLRHTHALELASENVPLPIISAQLGHSSSAVTARYIDHVANPQVIATMSRRSWSAAE